MNYKAVTFNFPIELHNELKMFVGNKNMSKFVSIAVKEKLEELEQNLKNAYIEASGDKTRNDEIDVWKTTESEDWK
jgi:hypothetical protein